MRGAVMRSITFVSLLFAVALMSAGCAAMQVAIEHKDLDVQTKMSETIFLDPPSPREKTIFVDIRNTSDKEVDILNDLVSLIVGKGYEVQADPGQAHFMIQANILQVGSISESARQSALHAGYGGVLAGAGVGAIAGGRSPGYGALAGGLIGGLAETVSGALVKNVTYSMIVDVQISEKSDAPVEQTTDSALSQGTQSTVRQVSADKTNWRRYRTRVVTTANKANLKFEEALPEIQKGLTRSIAGIM